jgi:hypothetical protein
LVVVESGATSRLSWELAASELDHGQAKLGSAAAFEVGRDGDDGGLRGGGGGASVAGRELVTCHAKLRT